MNIKNLIDKTIYHLRTNGITPTVKKVLRRLKGTDWLPREEDGLYMLPPFSVNEAELWQMPIACAPFAGRVSVVIPTFNGAHELPQLLELLHNQNGINDLEIVVVDSGSKDGTDILAEQDGCKVIRIPQSEFSHSHARMLGATAATGEYLLFMTQDALPDRTDWVLRMLQPCLVSDAAAVSCYESPKPDADLLSHITVWNWKNIMSGGHDRLTAMPDDASYDNFRRCAQLSDNACLVKRSIFMELGGHRGAYAEDLDLGIRLLQAGYKLGLLSTVSVVHSHNRPALYNFKRAIVDGVNIAGLFEDFRLDALETQEAMNRLFTAAAANRQFVRELNPNHPDQSPEEFAESIRNAYNRIIVSLKSVNNMEPLLFEDGDDLDESVRGFLTDLWSKYGSGYRFDGGLAAMQGRYLMHTVCPYLASVNHNIDSQVRKELHRLVWQYFGQSAGYCVAAAYLHEGSTNPHITETVEQYSKGV